MNMNYHASHHLWVSIPYYNLPAADRLMREHPGSVALEWWRSYVGYLWRYMRAMPLEECKG
jgi:fatty acid desaturase